MICAKPIFARGKNTHIDHDHKSGVVRGVLCNRCNLGLGYFQDDPQCLINAAVYLSYITNSSITKE